MNIYDEILINQYGQKLILSDSVEQRFSQLELREKRAFLKKLIYFFIQQTKAVSDNDILEAIENSHLKTTYTPCVILRKGGIRSDNLEKIVELPENELNKTLLLFLSIFQIGYLRRFELERNNLNKWWYWDLSKEENIQYILNEFSTE